jgi:hypothetical protein
MLRSLYELGFGWEAIEYFGFIIDAVSNGNRSGERMRAAVLVISDELTKDDLVLRYRIEGTDTGFSGEEGTFTICSFWLVSALALIGETDRARALCQKLLSFAGPLLLYAEEIDPATGEHLGNFRRRSRTWSRSRRCRCSSRPSSKRTSSPPDGIRRLAPRSVRDRNPLIRTDRGACPGW